jgi:hypothetical protein
MSFHPEWFGRAPIRSTVNAEANAFETARNIITDELEIAVVDRQGNRIKEKDIRTALKTVGRL